MILYRDYTTASTICANTWNTGDQNMASYMCSLYGAPATDDDMSYHWSDNASGWDNWGADHYIGNITQNGLGSVDVFVYDTNDAAMDWMISPAMDVSCLDQSSVLAIKCGATDFCLESGQSCAVDLDCCQSEEKPMYCNPTWGICVYTVWFYSFPCSILRVFC